jgi:ATP-dependent helicase HrpA
MNSTSISDKPRTEKKPPDKDRDNDRDIGREIRRLSALCGRAPGAERPALRREIRRISGNGPNPEKALERLETRIRAAVERRRRRVRNRPRPDYPEELPIAARREEIVEAIRRHPVVVISGDTGSGKSTQIPKFCLEAGRGVDGLIGCTQPRRIAAITLAQRIAEELGEPPGKSVGHKIRFQDETGDATYIKLMTDGILLAEAQADRRLWAYDTIIVDEAHERSLNIDFVLGILRTLVRRRRDLKLIVTSATIDTEKFSRAFDDAPVIEVSGRTYPVEVEYAPPEPGDEDATHVDLAVATLDRLHRERPYGGDVLVFMPTEQDIRETCELLEARNHTGMTVLPLFGRLSAGDQSRVFVPMRGRKVIVATNVAETSLTIPGIRYVVDTGLARISQYQPRTRTTALPVVPVSRSSADQRKGRCGRTAGGICIRLYSEEDYENRPRFTPPEILRSNLAEVILRMLALRLGDMAAFPFIDRPADRNIQDGFRLLEELGAVRRREKAGEGAEGATHDLTDRGRMMARLPLDPRISRMLLEGRDRGALPEIAVLAAALSTQDPRERPAEKEALADAAQVRFVDPRSDFLTLLNLWNAYHEYRSEGRGTSRMRRFCKEHFLSFRRMREWRDVHHQLRTILQENDLWTDSPPLDRDAEGEGFDPRYAAIHQSILSGFLSSIARRKEGNFYQAARDREVMLFPGSGLFKRGPEWVVAAEMVETSRLFARTAAAVDGDWLEPLAGDLVRRTYRDPHWERNRGEVVALEQVTLFGLILVPGRPVSYGRIDPEASREIFIRSALVEGDIRRPPAFVRHNRAEMEAVRELEDRMRRRDLLVGEEAFSNSTTGGFRRKSRIWRVCGTGCGERTTGFSGWAGTTS